MHDHPAARLAAILLALACDGVGTVDRTHISAMARRHIKLALLSAVSLVGTLYCFLAAGGGHGLAATLWGLAGVAGSIATVGLFLAAWWSRP
jgi:hypothetical protein